MVALDDYVFGALSAGPAGAITSRTEATPASKSSAWGVRTGQATASWLR
ncbi:MAG: hypothetical protein Q4G45_03705 [Actinomycetia bacterium]|nr:hypothetical protein [Actinomycetes bacterium]